MISFIVPCYNEENLVAQTVDQIEKTVKKINLKNYEILIVFDDGNKKTKKIINNLAKYKKNIKLILNKINLGYGGAVKIGIKKASKEFLMWIPGDNSHSHTEIYKVVKNYKKFDAITTFYSNAHLRSYYRRIFTSLYTPILNSINAKT